MNCYTHVAYSSKCLGCTPRCSGRFDAVKTLPHLTDLYANVELIQSEDKFTEIKDALKALNKMDFDKLISSVSASSWCRYEITSSYSLGLLKFDRRRQQKELFPVYRSCSACALQFIAFHFCREL